MERGEILSILSDYNYWGSYRPKLLDRPKYSAIIERMLKGKEIAVVTGVRRAGKSSIINEFVERHTQGDMRAGLIINLEDPRFPVGMSSKELNIVYDAYTQENGKEPRYVVLDEVQNIIGWERFARLLSEARGIKTIVTGSSSALMSEEYATVLTGRHVDVEVLPLSFNEFLLFNKITIKDKIERVTKKSKIIAMLNRYLRYGGFPAVVLASDDIRRQELLRAYFGDITVKDVIRRYKIKKQAQLEALAREYISNISSIQSFGGLAETLKISLDSVERFSKYLETARLLFFLSNFSYSTKAQTRSMKKAYAIDTGFYSSAGFKFSENIGKVMENVVAIELHRRRSRNPQMELFYYRKDYEVDFVVKTGKDIEELIQVTYASSKEEVQEREISSLSKASKELGCSNLTVITFDYEAESEVGKGNNVHFKPLWEWLLG